VRIGLAQTALLGPADARRQPRGLAVLGAACLFAAAGVLVPAPLARLTFVLTALVLTAVGLWTWVQVRREGRDRRAALAAAQALTAQDPVPCVLTGPDLGLIHANAAAHAAFAAEGETTLGGLLGGEIANAPAALDDMVREMRARGAARRSILHPRGGIALSVHQAGTGHCLWRIERPPAPPEPGAPDVAVPVLHLGDGGEVLSANAAARALLGWEEGREAHASRMTLPAPGQVCDIETARGRQPCLAVAWPRARGRRDLYLFPAPAVEPADGWSFFEALPVPLLKLARDGRILLSNAPARALLGIDSAEGRRLGEVIDGPGRPVADWLDDAAAGRGTVRAEIVSVRRRDRETFAHVALTLAIDGGERLLIAVLHDATQLKSLEVQFAQSQKMQAIGQLAGGVAHDFNNLLTAISGHCDLLLLRHDQDDGDYADLMQISQNANRAAALVGQLLAFSRKQTLRPEVMDLREMLLDLTHLLNRLVGERISLSLRHDPDLWSVRADRRQLEQVLMNLVVNARDAMPDGGEIRIVTANRRLGAPLERDRAVVAPGRYVELSVADEGVGIPPEHLGKVFEPFFTTKRPGEGTGLGLSTVYGIMKQTGGFIFADSAPGRGTCFQLLLPAHDPAPAGAVRAVEPAAPPRRRRSDGVVLLVEDEAPVRAFASRALKLRGLSVLEAASAEEALEVLKDEALRIDIFVSDVIMPGMDGPTWVREALKRRPDTRVVFMSGYAAETFEGGDDRLAGAVFLPKPFSLSDLTETVLGQLGP